jgi:RimJ/RimL family protein N-acetyltransferase
VTSFSTRRVELRAFEHGDEQFFVELATSIDVGRTYRSAGSIVAPLAREKFVYDGVQSHVVGLGRETRRRIGVASLTSADTRNATAFFSTITSSFAQRRVLAIEFTMLSIEYFFQTWALRKLYTQVPAFNMAAIRHVCPKYFREEGRLTEHAYLDGRYWDVFMLATTPDLWLKSGSVALRRMGLCERGEGF